MAIPKSGQGSSNSFARQYLVDHKTKVFRGDEQILTPVSKLYSIKLPNTRYFVGDVFVERKETQRVTVYSELRQMGWCIVSEGASDNKFMRGQRVIYKLVKYDENVKCNNNFPEGHFVEYDTTNKQIRLIGNKSGPLGYSEWISLEKVVVKKGARGPYSYKSYGENSTELIDNVHRKWMGMKEEPKPIYIPECAFMITDSNEIVCFPNTPDMPSILISGLKGTGKSYTMHSMLDRFFWKPAYDYKIIILNDSSRETGTWSLPNDGEDAILELKKLNERPLPLPIVYLHPSVKEDYEKLFMDDVGFDITIPFKEVIDNNKEYLKIDSGSARYFSQLKNDLLSFKTEKQVKDFLESIEDEYGVPPPSATKIRAEFDTLFDTKMTDISNEKQLPWGVSTSTKTFNPATACIKAGVLPVLETEYVSNQPKMLSIYFTYFVKDLFNRQKQDPEFVQEQSKVFLVIDEAHNISKKGFESGADMLLRRCVREGRPRRVGTLLATQKFNELPDIIKDNTTFLICFKNPGEAADIANQYKLGKAATKMITDLQKHECLAYTTEHFIIYDSNGNKRKSKANEIFKGRSLPPYSLHKRPDEGR